MAQEHNSANTKPAMWKNSMLILLALYPVVFFNAIFIQRPLALAKIPLWAALFLGSCLSVTILSLLLPRVFKLFSWWLAPSMPSQNITLRGLGLVLAIYGVWLLVFSQLPIR